MYSTVVLPTASKCVPQHIAELREVPFISHFADYNELTAPDILSWLIFLVIRVASNLGVEE